ncbi:MAG: hypothetical protein QXK39_03395 [Nitrososphaerota archaeon]
MRIALDVDGVLADLAGMILRIYGEDTGIWLDRSFVTEWEFWTKLGMSRREFVDLIVRAWSRWEEINPTEDDLAEDTDMLARLGRVEILTQRPAATVEPVKRWLRKHGVRHHGFTWVPLKSSKTLFHYDIYIDDSPRLAEHMRKLKRPLLLYSQPWNASIVASDSVVRVSSLDECINYVISMGV